MEKTRINSPLFTERNTYVEHEKDFNFNAPHHFEVRNVHNGELLVKVDFQEGPIKEHGINGASNEDLLAMVHARLTGFQNSQYKCDENALALHHLEMTIEALRSRTQNRETRGVLGTSQI